MTLHQSTLAELASGLASGDFSSRELTESLLARIESHGETLNAFITVTADAALVQADRADKARANGDAGPLAGLPIVHKDLYCTKGVLTTCGSNILGNFVSPYDATVVERMANAGGVAAASATR
ncbi:MAG: amidase family protein [Lysobacterales bacterium]